MWRICYICLMKQPPLPRTVKKEVMPRKYSRRRFSRKTKKTHGNQATGVGRLTRESEREGEREVKLERRRGFGGHLKAKWSY